MNFLTTAQVAQRLGVDPSTVRRWCESGRLEAIKPGHDWLVPVESLDGFEPPKRGRPKEPQDAAERTKQ